jgi:hypothetical protein
MELYACGFNAWNQVSFSDGNEEELNDLHEFQCVLRDGQIEILRAAFTSTLGK